MSAKRCLAVCLCLLPGTAAQAQINLAGVYELNRKVDISVHQMYLELDFVNSRPDFTQSFSGQKASFKYLPADFMNAKKLKQNFKGTTAPGFARYREKAATSQAPWSACANCPTTAPRRRPARSAPPR